MLGKKPVQFRPLSAFGALILLIGILAVAVGSIMVAVVCVILGGSMLASGLMTND